MMSPEALAQLRVNPDWASLPLFNRTGWTRVRFGDVVENCNETCDPTEAGLDRFIAMDHLEPGSLHVESWGNVADGTTFTRRCWPGQVLFGRRRAYQRKVAVAESEAVVSGDIYVLAPTDANRLLPELLPFICLSERFFQHAVGTSAGSLSPRTKWDSLASFEFDLPPLDQQRRIARLLSALDTSSVNAGALAVAVDRLWRVELEQTIDLLMLGRTARLTQVLTRSPEGGCSAVPSAAPTGHYVLALSALSKFGYRAGHLKAVEPSREMLASRLVRGDFLVSRSNTPELVGLVGLFNDARTDVSFPDTMMRLSPDEAILRKRFLEIVMLSNRGRRHMTSTAAGTRALLRSAL